MGMAVSFGHRIRAGCSPVGTRHAKILIGSETRHLPAAKRFGHSLETIDRADDLWSMSTNRRADIFRFVHHSADGRRWAVLDTASGAEIGSFRNADEAIAAALSANRDHSLWRPTERATYTLDLV